MSMSRCIVRLCRTQNVSAAYPVMAILHPCSRQDVYLASKDGLQLITHCNDVEKPRSGPWRKAYEYIYVAIWPEIIPEHGPEEGEFDYAPTAAEVHDNSARNIYRWL